MCFSFSNDDELSFRWHWSSSATSMLIIVCTCISALWWFLLNCFGLSKNHQMRINQPLHIRSMWVNDPRSVLKSAIQHHEQSNIVSKQIALMSLCYTAVYNIVIVIAINNWRTSAHSIDIRNVHWFPSIRRCRRRKKPWQLTTVKNHWCWYAQPLAFRSVRLQFVTHYSKRRQRRNGKKNHTLCTTRMKYACVPANFDVFHTCVVALFGIVAPTNQKPKKIDRTVIRIEWWIVIINMVYLCVTSSARHPDLSVVATQSIE